MPEVDAIAAPMMSASARMYLLCDLSGMEREIIHTILAHDWLFCQKTCMHTRTRTYVQFVLHRIRKELSKRGIESLLITNLINIRYVTTMDMSFGYLLITKNRATLFCDDRYFETARTTLPRDICITHVRDFPDEFRSLRRCGIESSLTLSQHNRLKRTFRSVRLVPTEGIIERCRREKSPYELACIKRACALTKRILKRIPSWLIEGMTETALARRIRDEAEAEGADCMAFDTIVAFGTNTAFPHHHPTDRHLRNGDIVQIDLGVKVGGYCSDYSRVFFTGRMTREQRRAMKALRYTLRSCKQMISIGRSAASIDVYARKALKKIGYDTEFCHALGHGVGLEIHEGIVLSKHAKKTSENVLLKNEVITLEPGLYFPGAWGMRIEDTILIR